MTRKTSKILSDEHQNILKVIDVLERAADKIENGAEIKKEFFEKAIDFIRGYADKFHHAKEEDILFKELGKDTVEMHCNPIDQMLVEHDEGRSFVKQMEEGVEENNREKIVEGARGYVNLLREHISKEDQVLYPMADQVLDEDVEESMLKRFEAVAKRDEEKEKKFLEFVNKLSKKQRGTIS